jgi:hypothetical protein
MKNILTLLLTFTIKSAIATSMLYFAASLFIFNIQIQQNDFTKKDNLIYTYELVQREDFMGNLHAYFVEDCNFLCLPDKTINN